MGFFSDQVATRVSVCDRLRTGCSLQPECGSNVCNRAARELQQRAVAELQQSCSRASTGGAAVEVQLHNLLWGGSGLVALLL